MTRPDAQQGVLRLLVRVLAGMAVFAARQPAALAQGELEPAESAGAEPVREREVVPKSALPEVRPPEVLDAPEPEYPAAALRDRIEGSVVLRVTVDVDGSVEEAEVIEPAGHGFDESARKTALRTRYRPARRGHTPVRARILTRVDFGLPAAPTTGSLSGRVLLGVGGTHPAAGIEVTVSTADGVTTQARTDAEGWFFLDALAPGGCIIVASGPGLGQVQLRTKVVAGEAARVTARLEPHALAEAPVEVTVQGLSDAERRRQSAEAVTVVELDQAQRESADMGEVLARTQGVGVRRSGGLGSETRFSLNGLTDDQVRFFLDGVPLEYAGYPSGIVNIPVNLVDRVEIYSGVVPIRFGADALGGAVNLVTDGDLSGQKLQASYEVGSFGTYRMTLAGRYRHEPTGLFARASGFWDHANNDYPIDVEIADDSGQLSPATVRRFHDVYRAAGGNVELGVVERPWARRLLVRAFVTDYDREYQHNVPMTVPYGGVTYGESSTGASLRYDNSFGHGVALDAVTGYTYERGHFLDVATCVYVWTGHCVRPRDPGETDSRPFDQVYDDHSGFGRFNLSWHLHRAHALRLAVAPTYFTRTGDERRQTDPTARDPLSAERKLFSVVNGLEYELDLFGDRLENILFVKQYFQRLNSEEPRPGGSFRRRDRDTHRGGIGDGLRFRFTPWLYAKTSYEWATRLPSPEELFGDNAFVVANLELQPETSHNYNLGLTLDLNDTASGDWRATSTGFLRDAEHLIVLLGSERVQSHQNVYAARSLGVEAALGWTSPGGYFALDGNGTYVDFRNTSSDGTFGNFEGDRIPNRPYLYGNASARLSYPGVLAPGDEVSVGWNVRYVHEFFRGWESIGAVEHKQVVPAQSVHGANLGYLVAVGGRSVSTTFEVQNLTDESVFDFYGVQRPGRGYYLKGVADFE
ncbi:MAG TPA: TonB-dependent siderophore myxochelin receptor MxcH [Polyangiaceae bacterium]|nr:TonB-dependent siderophore myxochelin receptor MxcH [Polyangiaceae bacterium]